MINIEKFKIVLQSIYDKQNEISAYHVSKSHSTVNNESKWKELFINLDLELKELEEKLFKMYMDAK